MSGTNKQKENKVLQVGLPSQLLPGQDGVVVGEGLIDDGGLDLGQQTTTAAAAASFGLGDHNGRRLSLK